MYDINCYPTVIFDHFNRWGQICILTALADYHPVDSKEAESIIERVIPRLQHANASVGLSAVKVFFFLFWFSVIVDVMQLSFLCKDIIIIELVIHSQLLNPTVFFLCFFSSYE